MKSIHRVAPYFFFLFSMIAAAQTSAVPQPIQTHNIDTLRSSLQRIRGQFAGDMSIYAKNLVTHEEIAIDSDSVYETFSVIKLAIATELLHQERMGKLSLSDRVTLEAANRRLPSGVLYTLDPGLTPTLGDLLTLMIIISDNEATDAIADRVGRNNATAYMNSLGLSKTTIEFRIWTGTGPGWVAWIPLTRRPAVTRRFFFPSTSLGMPK